MGCSNVSLLNKYGFRVRRRLTIGAMMLLVAFALVDSAHALDPEKLISQFTHTAWSAKDGIPGPVRAITQTPDGFLWLGTEAGLYRFDGLQFAPWKSNYNEQLPTSSVLALCVARDGGLWIGFGSGAIAELRDGHVRTYTAENGVPGGYILSIVQDTSGAIWAGGPYGLVRLEGARWRRIGAAEGYPAPGAQSLLVDDQGRLWVATDGASFDLSTDPVRVNTILTLAQGAKRFTATGEAVGMVWTMANSPEGAVWIADTTAKIVRPISGAGADKKGIPLDGETLCLLFAGPRTLWIGLIDRGIRQVSDFGSASAPASDRFQASDGLSGGLVQSAFKDREGNLWFGTVGGLDRFSENKVTAYSAKEGLNPDQQLALAATANGSVWALSYTRDSVRQFDEGHFVTWALPSYSASETTRILCLTSKGNDVLVGGNFFLAREAGGDFSFVPVPNIPKGTNVEAAAYDVKGDLWLTLTGWWPALPNTVSRILRLKNGAWTDFSTRANLPKYHSRVIYGDSAGRVWFGFENGEVAVCEDGQFRVYSEKDGLPSGRIFAIASDRAGQLWVGGEGGLSRLQSGRFTTLTAENGLPGNSVSGIVEDEEGSLWLACGLGVFRVGQAELNKALASHTYRMEGFTIGATDGLRGLPRQREPFPTATRAADGRLWFATTGGVAMIDPHRLTKNLFPPPVAIEAVNADDRVFTAPGFRLPPNTRNVEFAFAALSLTDPDRAQFRYKLEGYDKEWQGPVMTRRVRYTNLSPATYRFRVVASNNDGVWNKSGALWDFSLAPAFYQTLWFRAAMLLALASFLAALYKTRLRRIKRHNAELRQEINERKGAESALHASEQVARGQVEALVQSLDILATAPPPEKFIGEMLSTIGRLLNAQSVVLWLFDEGTESFSLRAGAHGADLGAMESSHPFITHPTSWKENEGLHEMIFTGVPQSYENLETNPRISEGIRAYFRANGTKRFLTIPTLVGGRVKGFIGIRHGERAAYRPEEIELAQALAHQAMFAIQLNEFAEQDQRAAVLEERNRMARDIHDNLAQGLTGVIVQLQAAEDATAKGYKKEAQDHLQNARNLARQGLREARRSVRALRPQALEEGTFSEAFESLIKNAAVGTPLQIEFQVAGEIRELPSLAQEHLLHIGQEALTNTLKYAHATRFETRLSFHPKEVRLELQDNGIGFELDRRHNGFGLTGMKERVAQIGGQVTIASARGQGTKVVVVLLDA